MAVGQQLFYKDKPVFGFDIGRSSIKVMQLTQGKKGSVVEGYGTISFDPSAIVNGVVVNPEAIIKASYDLIEKQLVGKLVTAIFKPLASVTVTEAKAEQPLASVTVAT